MTDVQETLPERAQQYFDMLERLEDIRKQHNGEDSPEEDSLLDEMDLVWYSMTKDEIDVLERHADRKEDHAD